MKYALLIILALPFTALAGSGSSNDDAIQVDPPYHCKPTSSDCLPGWNNIGDRALELIENAYDCGRMNPNSDCQLNQQDFYSKKVFVRVNACWKLEYEVSAMAFFVPVNPNHMVIWGSKRWKPLCMHLLADESSPCAGNPPNFWQF